MTAIPRKIAYPQYILLTTVELKKLLNYRRSKPQKLYSYTNTNVENKGYKLRVPKTWKTTDIQTQDVDIMESKTVEIIKSGNV